MMMVVVVKPTAMKALVRFWMVVVDIVKCIAAT
jgi:hypothetical protein